MRKYVLNLRDLSWICVTFLTALADFRNLTGTVSFTFNGEYGGSGGTAINESLPTAPASLSAVGITYQENG
jgi:hypothetical protein